MRRPPVLGAAGLALLLLSCDATGPKTGPQGPHLIIVAGNWQSAAPGSQLPNTLFVRLADSTGDTLAQAGVTVRFAVASGGGSVTPTSSTTDAAGIASTTWTIGASRGANTVTASMKGAPSVTFTAFGVQQDTNIAITVTSPATGAVVDSIVHIDVHITSLYSISAVTAAVSGAQANLASTGSGNWAGDLGIKSAPHDSLGLLITATDAFGGVGNVGVPIVHDIAPKLTVTEPAPFAIAQPSIQVRALCSDADGPGSHCDSVTVDRGGTSLLSGHDSIVGTVSLAGSEGSTVMLYVRGHDRFTQTVDSIPISVQEPGPLSLVTSMPGTVRDYASGRVLSLDSAGTHWIIRNLAGHADTTLTGMPTFMSGFTLPDPFLVPSGAVVNAAVNASAYPAAWFWHAGTATQLYQYAVGRGLGDLVSCCGGLYNLGTGSLISGHGGSIGPDTSVAYVCCGNDFNYPRYGTLVRDRFGVTDTLARSGSSSVEGPALNAGSSVLFLRCCLNHGYLLSALYVYAGGAETLLSEHASSQPNYMVAGAWAAYQDTDLTSTIQVFTRAPDGTIRQASHFGTQTTPEALGPDGRVVVLNGGQRYLLSPPYSTAPTAVSGSQGHAIARDNGFYLLTGPNVYQIH